MIRLLIVLFSLVALASCTVAPQNKTLTAANNSPSDISHFENRLAEKLLHLAYIDINQADKNIRTNTIDSHIGIIRRAVDMPRLSRHNQLQVRLLDELLLAEQVTDLSPESKIEHLILHSTLELDAASIADLARSRLSRVQERITLLMGTEDTSSLPSLFEELRNDGDNYRANTEEGRQQYLTLIVDRLIEIDSVLPLFIDTQSHKELNLMGFDNDGTATVRAFNYDKATTTLEVDLTDMGQLPLFETETVALFYGVPGLHTIAGANDRFEIQSLMDLETYRNGWAAYATSDLDQIPLYQHPKRVLKRSYTELLFLTLAIIDHSINSLQFTDDDAVIYLLKNTPYPAARIERSVKLVHQYPGFYFGQFIGLLEFEALRKMAIVSLNENFDPVEFHKYLVELGPLPFPELEFFVAQWVSRKL